MTLIRQYSFLDNLCLGFDQILRTMTNHPKSSGRAYPAAEIEEALFEEEERKSSAALMRINHAGEICAQALYQGQGLVSRSSAVREQMQQAALEEGDHLNWCKKRLTELNSRTSYLNPFWYAGSFCIGAMAGLVGDQWSLGFVAETERQVIKHLDNHLHLLPQKDQRTFQIIKQMETDEAHHRDEAITWGAKELPQPVKWIMTLASKVMVKTAYWI